MRDGKWHILGPKSHVSIASLVERILAVAMEIWNHEGSVHIVAYDQRLNALEFRICSFGSSGVIQLFVRSTIPTFAPHVAFCPVRVVIPSVNSKQPA